VQIDITCLVIYGTSPIVAIKENFFLRKNRKGAFWEDRYHATAIKNGDYLIQGMVYIDLNMIRAGVVQHPAQWMFGG
jgi:putative transposase